MAFWQGEKGRRPTGGMITIARKKRKYEMGSLPVHTKIGTERKLRKRNKGGMIKIKLSSAEFANVMDKKNNSVKKVKILDVIKNPANPQLVRSKIITKGCVIKTEIGNARVTSRPSQHGIVNALRIDSNEEK